jgi:hypothetical protein
MEAPDHAGDEQTSPKPTNDCDVTAHESSPDRIVFTEEGNTDGWIATDFTTELLR